MGSSCNWTLTLKTRGARGLNGGRAHSHRSRRPGRSPGSVGDRGGGRRISRPPASGTCVLTILKALFCAPNNQPWCSARRPPSATDAHARTPAGGLDGVPHVVLPTYAPASKAALWFLGAIWVDHDNARPRHPSSSAPACGCASGCEENHGAG
jgi:hypothetical protein